MVKLDHKKPDDDSTPMSIAVGKQEALKIRNIMDHHKNVWLGLGVSGAIGWSIAIPAVLGALLGVWLDKHRPGPHSWTLALLTAGLVLGCWNAWNWVNSEDKAINPQREKTDV